MDGTRELVYFKEKIESENEIKRNYVPQDVIRMGGIIK